MIEHQHLHTTTQKSRSAIGKALDKRILLKRYGPPAWNDLDDDGVCRYHDIGLVMHPLWAGLHYILPLVKLYSGNNALDVTIKRRVDQVKRKIYGQLKKMVVQVLKENDVDGAPPPGTEGGAATERATAGMKRGAGQATLNQAKGKKGRQQAATLLSIFAGADVQEAAPEEPQGDADLLKRAEEEVEAYLNSVNNNKVGDQYEIKQTIQYWAEVGQRLFPIIAEVARSVLALPGGSGNLERDFCKSGNLITPQRASLDYR